MPVTAMCEEEAWALVLQLRDAGWSAATPTSFYAAGSRLDVSPDGAWQCTPSAGPEAAALFDVFLPLVARAAPLVMAQIGQSLDGRIATDNGHSHYINCAAARAHLHRLRAVVDAVVVGVGTADADRPQLTVRHVAGRNPVRVVLDPRGRAQRSGALFLQPQAPTLHVVSAGCAVGDASDAGHVQRVHLPAGADGFAPRAVIDLLAAHGLKNVLIEGGGITVSRFLHARVLDRLHVMVAPLLIGSGRTGLSLPSIGTLDEALRPRSRSFACGTDTLFDLELSRG